MSQHSTCRQGGSAERTATTQEQQRGELAMVALTKEGPKEIGQKTSKDAYTVTSSWVLTGGTLKTLTRSLAQCGEGVQDMLGFDGMAVCGQYFYHMLQTKYGKHMSDFEQKDEKQLYRFGGGTAVAWRSFELQVMLGGAQTKISVDVVPGTLPLLLGRKFGDQFWLHVDIRRGVTAMEMSSGEFRVVALQTSRTGVFRMNLFGEEVSRQGFCGRVAAAGEEAQQKYNKQKNKNMAEEEAAES